MWFCFVQKTFLYFLLQHYDSKAIYLCIHVKKTIRPSAVPMARQQILRIAASNQHKLSGTTVVSASCFLEGVWGSQFLLNV